MGECKWHVCMSVLVMSRLIQGPQAGEGGGGGRVGGTRPEAGIGMLCPHLLAGSAAAPLWFAQSLKMERAAELKGQGTGAYGGGRGGKGIRT